MEYHEFVVVRDGHLRDSSSDKRDAISIAKKYKDQYPESEISIKAHVYGKPLDAWDVGNHYLYSYDVDIE